MKTTQFQMKTKSCTSIVHISVWVWSVFVSVCYYYSFNTFARQRVVAFAHLRSREPLVARLVFGKNETTTKPNAKAAWTLMMMLMTKQ